MKNVNGSSNKFVFGVGQIVVSCLVVLWIVHMFYISDPRVCDQPKSVISIRNVQERNKQIISQENEDSLSAEDPIDSPVESFRKCSLSAYLNTTSDSVFIEQYRKCIEQNIPYFNFDKFRMGRYDEDKVFIPMNYNYDKHHCNWLTVGIGGDTNVEKEFKEKYPECKIYGVEASPDQYSNFKDYGVVIPYGVAVKNGSFLLTLREKTRYIKKEVPVLAMANLLDKYVGTRRIHYMTIDIEGFEYSILQELPGGKALSKQDIVFCQIDAELHKFPGNSGSLRDFLHQFDLENSDYVPVYSIPFLTHQKVTLVNFDDKECLESFDLSKLVNGK